MNYKFKKFGGDLVPDLGQYVRDYLSTHDAEDVSVHVGCDSNQGNRYTMYGIVVVMYHEHRGGTFVFNAAPHQKNGKFIKLKDPSAAPDETAKLLSAAAVAEIFPRVWGEVERVKEVADYLEKELEGHYHRYTADELIKLGYSAHQNKLVEAHIDVNPEPGLARQNKSNIVYDAALSYLTGFGYRVRTKPNAWAATCCADLIAGKSASRKKQFDK